MLRAVLFRRKPMSAKKFPEQKSLSVADRLGRQLAKIKAAQRKKFLNENIVRLEKNGDLSYQTVRTTSVPNFCPETPVQSENGQQFDRPTEPSSVPGDPPAASEVVEPQPVAAGQASG